MNDYYEDSYLEDEIDEFNVITELSRQLRSFLRYKEEVIRCRFQNTFTQSLYCDAFKYSKDKNELHEVATNFIHILKKIKKSYDSVERGILYLSRSPDCPLFGQLIVIMNTLFILIHKFSECKIHNHPRLLKLLISLAREACALKKRLNLDIEEFFSELELGYEKLEEELNEILSQWDHRESVTVKKQLEEKLGI